MKIAVTVTIGLLLFVCGILIGHFPPVLNLGEHPADIIIAIATAAGSVTTAVAAIIAVVGIFSQRQSVRAQHTISHLASTERDRDIIEAKKIFLEVASKQGGLGKYAYKEHGETESAICKVLNHYELISLGIQSGIIDYEVFKRWNRSTVLFVWRSAAPFVAEHRKIKSSPMLWHEFEELARDFNSDKKPQRKIRKMIS